MTAKTARLQRSKIVAAILLTLLVIVAVLLIRMPGAGAEENIQGTIKYTDTDPYTTWGNGDTISAPVTIIGPPPSAGTDPLTITISGEVTVMSSITCINKVKFIKAEGAGSAILKRHGVSAAEGDYNGDMLVVGGTVDDTYIGAYVQVGDVTLDGNKVDVTAGSPLIRIGSNNPAENPGTHTLALNNSNLINNRNSNNGGAILLNDGTVTMYGSSISGNEVTGNSSGGGVYMTGGAFIMSDSDASSSSIKDNTSAQTGGGVYMLDGSFTMNGNSSISGNSSESATSGGGGVYLFDGNFTMNGGTIGGATAADGNEVTGANGQGGGVYNDHGDFIMNNSSSISGNKVTGENGKGGGVYVRAIPDDPGTFTMNETSSISRNGVIGADDLVGGQGGGVYMADGVFNLNSGIIGGEDAADANTARDGGGVCMADGVFTMGVNGAISNNTASDGGGVSVLGGQFDMNGGGISNNTAGTAGGGVYMDSGAFEMNGASSISGNTAQSGGGVHVSDDAAFTMTKGSISNNNATLGGGVTVSEASFTMSDGEISNNSVTVATTTLPIGGQGGGVYLLGINTAATFAMTNGSISGNTATDGGGVYLLGTDSAATFTMTNGSISENAATYGGGVYVDGTDSAATFTLIDGEISKNTATENGGGAFLDENGEFFLQGGGITGNSATTDGGGIYAADSGFAKMFGGVTGGEISDNTAINGGGVYLAAGGGAQIGGVLITDNYATADGGGIYASVGSTLTVTNNPVDNDGNSGPAQVFGNNNGNGANNIYLSGAGTNRAEITVLAALAAGASLGLTAAEPSIDPPATVVARGANDPAHPENNYPITEADLNKFYYDKGLFLLDLDTGINAIVLAENDSINVAKVTLTTGEERIYKCNPDDIDHEEFSYATASEALQAAVNDAALPNVTLNHTVTVMRDILLGAGEITVTHSTRQPVIITGQGCTITTEAGFDKPVLAVGLSGSEAQLTLDNINLQGHNAATAPLIVVDSGLTGADNPALILDDATTLTGNTNSGNGGAIGVTKGMVVMAGGEISGNSAAKGGAVYLGGNGSGLLLNDGDIIGNSATDGAGVYVDAAGSSFTMTGGSIGGAGTNANIAANSGGGVYVNELGSSFTMSGGQIYTNEATGMTTDTTVYGGGGVFLANGAMTMSGGEIFGNSANQGGGIYLGNGYIANKSSLTLTGGIITENTATAEGGGIYVQNNALTVSGAPKVIGNTSGATPVDDNIFLHITEQGGGNVYNRFIWVSGALTPDTEPDLGVHNGAQLGVRLADHAPDTVIAKKSIEYTELVPNDAKAFSDDHDTLQPVRRQSIPDGIYDQIQLDNAVEVSFNFEAFNADTETPDLSGSFTGPAGTFTATDSQTVALGDSFALNIQADDYLSFSLTGGPENAIFESIGEHSWVYTATVPANATDPIVITAEQYDAPDLTATAKNGYFSGTTTAETLPLTLDISTGDITDFSLAYTPPVAEFEGGVTGAGTIESAYAAGGWLDFADLRTLTYNDGLDSARVSFNMSGIVDDAATGSFSVIYTDSNALDLVAISVGQPHLIVTVESPADADEATLPTPAPPVGAYEAKADVDAAFTFDKDEGYYLNIENAIPGATFAPTDAENKYKGGTLTLTGTLTPLTIELDTTTELVDLTADYRALMAGTDFYATDFAAALRTIIGAPDDDTATTTIDEGDRRLRFIAAYGDPIVATADDTLAAYDKVIDKEMLTGQMGTLLRDTIIGDTAIAVDTILDQWATGIADAPDVRLDLLMATPGLIEGDPRTVSRFNSWTDLQWRMETSNHTVNAGADPDAPTAPSADVLTTGPDGARRVELTDLPVRNWAAQDVGDPATRNLLNELGAAVNVFYNTTAEDGTTVREQLTTIGAALTYGYPDIPTPEFIYVETTYDGYRLATRTALRQTDLSIDKTLSDGNSHAPDTEAIASGGSMDIDNNYRTGLADVKVTLADPDKSYSSVIGGVRGYLRWDNFYTDDTTLTSYIFDTHLRAMPESGAYLLGFYHNGELLVNDEGENTVVGFPGAIMTLADPITSVPADSTLIFTPAAGLEQSIEARFRNLLGEINASDALGEDIWLAIEDENFPAVFNITTVPDIMAQWHALSDGQQKDIAQLLQNQPQFRALENDDGVYDIVEVKRAFEALVDLQDALRTAALKLEAAYTVGSWADLQEAVRQADGLIAELRRGPNTANTPALERIQSMTQLVETALEKLLFRTYTVEIVTNNVTMVSAFAVGASNDDGFSELEQQDAALLGDEDNQLAAQYVTPSELYPAGAIYIFPKYGRGAQVNITPDPGWAYVATLDNNTTVASSPITIENITKSYQLRVMFAAQTFDIPAATGDHATLYYQNRPVTANTLKFTYGEPLTLTVRPNQGYVLFPSNLALESAPFAHHARVTFADNSSKDYYLNPDGTFTIPAGDTTQAINSIDLSGCAIAIDANTLNNWKVSIASFYGNDRNYNYTLASWNAVFGTNGVYTAGVTQYNYQQLQTALLALVPQYQVAWSDTKLSIDLTDTDNISVERVGAAAPYTYYVERGGLVKFNVADIPAGNRLTGVSYNMGGVTQTITAAGTSFAIFDVTAAVSAVTPQFTGIGFEIAPLYMDNWSGQYDQDEQSDMRKSYILTPAAGLQISRVTVDGTEYLRGEQPASGLQILWNPDNVILRWESYNSGAHTVSAATDAAVYTLTGTDHITLTSNKSGDGLGQAGYGSYVYLTFAAPPSGSQLNMNAALTVTMGSVQQSQTLAMMRDEPTGKFVLRDNNGSYLAVRGNIKVEGYPYIDSIAAALPDEKDNVLALMTQLRSTLTGANGMINNSAYQQDNIVALQTAINKAQPVYNRLNDSIISNAATMAALIDHINSAVLPTTNYTTIAQAKAGLEKVINDLRTAVKAVPLASGAISLPRFAGVAAGSVGSLNNASSTIPVNDGQGAMMPDSGMLVISNIRTMDGTYLPQQLIIDNTVVDLPHANVVISRDGQDGLWTLSISAADLAALQGGSLRSILAIQVKTAQTAKALGAGLGFDAGFTDANYTTYYNNGLPCPAQSAAPAGGYIRIEPEYEVESQASFSDGALTPYPYQLDSVTVGGKTFVKNAADGVLSEAVNGGNFSIDIAKASAQGVADFSDIRVNSKPTNPQYVTFRDDYDKIAAAVAALNKDPLSGADIESVKYLIGDITSLLAQYEGKFETSGTDSDRYDLTPANKARFTQQAEQLRQWQKLLMTYRDLQALAEQIDALYAEMSKINGLMPFTPGSLLGQGQEDDVMRLEPQVSQLKQDYDGLSSLKKEQLNAASKDKLDQMLAAVNAAHLTVLGEAGYLELLVQQALETVGDATHYSLGLQETADQARQAYEDYLDRGNDPIPAVDAGLNILDQKIQDLAEADAADFAKQYLTTDGAALTNQNRIDKAPDAADYADRVAEAKNEYETMPRAVRSAIDDLFSGPTIVELYDGLFAEIEPGYDRAENFYDRYLTDGSGQPLNTDSEAGSRNIVAAESAWDQLTPSEQAQVNALLEQAGSPDYQDLLALAKAKLPALAELEEAFAEYDKDDYSKAAWKRLKAAYEAALQNIVDGSTIAEVEEALAAGLKAMDKIQTGDDEDEDDDEDDEIRVIDAWRLDDASQEYIYHGSGVTVISFGVQKDIITVDHDSMARLIAEIPYGSTIVIPAQLDPASAAFEVRLNAELVRQMAEKNIRLIVRCDRADFLVPATSVDVNALAVELSAGSDLRHLWMSINMNEPIDSVQQRFRNNAAQEGYNLITMPFDFAITGEYNSVVREIRQYKGYVSRDIRLPIGVSLTGVTAGMTMDISGNIYAVPLRSYTNAQGVNYARLSTKTNSCYALIYYSTGFTDLSGKWYGAVVSEMAGRRIVGGYSDGSFQGDGRVTRAEFAVLLVRALGLRSQDLNTFTDVTSTDWYSGETAAAYAYGLVNGYSGGNYDPNAYITREEAMTMISRAAALAELPALLNMRNFSSEYIDLGTVSGWALDSVNYNLNHSLIIGAHQLVRPQAYITRGETATVILRLLQRSGLVDIRTMV